MKKVIITVEYGAKKDEIIEWAFNNTKNRFCYDGIPIHRIFYTRDNEDKWHWYFENDEDAVLFKLTWGGEDDDN